MKKREMERQKSMSRTEAFDGGPFSPFWWHDKGTLYHNKFRVTLDQKVDIELLRKAWDKTKRVYPLIDWVPDIKDGSMIFYPGPVSLSLPVLRLTPTRGLLRWNVLHPSIITAIWLLWWVRMFFSPLSLIM